MIYCVEDDSSIRDLMIYALNTSGFKACGFDNAQGLYDALAQQRPELIMLDIMLPDGRHPSHNARGEDCPADWPCRVDSEELRRGHRRCGLWQLRPPLPDRRHRDGAPGGR